MGWIGECESGRHHSTASHSGADRHETGEQRVAGMVMEEIKRLGREKGDLQRRCKGDKGESGGGAPVVALKFKSQQKRS